MRCWTNVFSPTAIRHSPLRQRGSIHLIRGLFFGMRQKGPYAVVQYAGVDFVSSVT